MSTVLTSFPLFPLPTVTMSLQNPLKFMLSCSIINTVTHIRTYTIHTHYLVSPFVAAFIYLYYLRLDNLCLGSKQGQWKLPVEQTDSPSFSCHWLLLALHLSVGPWEISSVQISLPSGVVTMPIISRQVDCQDFMHVAFLSQVEDTVQQKS